MLFPYMSTYAHLLKRNKMSTPFDQVEVNQQPDQPGMKPWTDAMPEQTSTGFHGFGADSRKRAIYSGLLGAGLQLLEAAPRGDFGGGLTRGAAAFPEGFASSRERAPQ